MENLKYLILCWLLCTAIMSAHCKEENKSGIMRNIFKWLSYMVAGAIGIQIHDLLK